jgi:antitoxin component YwqK of YwqJK toxin-antitoxin module
MYYENGKIMEKIFYKNDKIEGEYIAYYGNDNICIKCNYKKDNLEGEYIQYYLSGTIEKSIVIKIAKKKENIFNII